MARKRMLDPNIWVSEDVAMLSIFARLMFIGMISNADDEGKGRANVAYLKSTIFPYDEDVSTRKVNDALKTISEHCSVEIYEVDGKQYYRFKNWKSWQKVEKPSPSQIPNPPQPFGEHSGNNSGNNRGTLVDESRLIRKEKNKNIISLSKNADACASASDNENILVSFINNTGIKDAYFDEGVDYKQLETKILESDYLQKASFYWIVKNYEKVMKNAYKNHPKTTSKNNVHFANERTYTREELESFETNVDELDI